MKRKDARAFAMQTLFQMEVQKDFENPDVEKYLSREGLEDQREYVERLIAQVAGHIDQIHEIIDECSRGWKESRMAKVDLAILRLAIGEMLYIDDVPAAVSINEAVNLAKAYGTEHSPSFVNGVLGKVAKLPAVSGIK
jgi:N utilization substance protein B